MLAVGMAQEGMMPVTLLLLVGVLVVVWAAPLQARDKPLEVAVRFQWRSSARPRRARPRHVKEKVQHQHRQEQGKRGEGQQQEQAKSGGGQQQLQ
jgi:hypothetical protein